jgi:pectate lyase
MTMKIFLSALAILACSACSSALAADGFCTVSGTTNYNLTGGAGGTTTLVGTASAFISAVQAAGPRVVIVTNNLGSFGSITVSSSKTIQGVCTNGRIQGQLSIDKGVSNIIVSNLTMVGQAGVVSSHCIDILNGAHHVFVTHCDMSNVGDECLSVTKTADYVTVSWNRFHFDNAGSHTYAHLIGSDDGLSADSNKLHVTFHHNWYGTNVTQRMPRVRYGQVHVYNNYYHPGPGDSYCVGVGYKCHIRLENSYFDGVSSPWADYSNGGGYDFGYTNNVFVNCSQPTWAVNSNTTIFYPPYSYSNGLDSATSVKDIVMAGAGPQCASSPTPPSASFTGTPTDGTAPLAVTFTDTSTGDITNRYWTFGDGATSNTTATTMNHTYNAGTYTVSLTVSGSGGSNTLARSNYITAIGPPLAGFTASPTNGTEPLAVTFTDTSTGTAPLSLSWNLGDGFTTNTAGGASFGHTYAAGTYTVTLTASNSAGTSTLVSNNLITAITSFQAWQLQYFGCTDCEQAAPDADPLGKGISNTNQFLLGLNPTNPASVFRITSVVTDSGTNVRISWSTAGVRTNAVQATTGDAGGDYGTNDFQDISGATLIINVSGDTTTNYTDVGGATNVPARYYRIRLVP